MPLAPVITSKEGNYQPVLLCSLTFPDGSVLYLSTHNFNTAEGGNQYNGNTYLSRVSKQDIQQVQARSEQGIDRISDVTLHLIDDDRFLYVNYEEDSAKGFKGAIMRLALVMMDIDNTGTYIFSSDATPPLKFTGICDPPACKNGGQTFDLHATTSHNLAVVDLPVLRVQQRSVTLFPRNADERLAGATDMSSWWWGCGYNPDRTGTDPEIGGDCRRGNTTTPNATDSTGKVIADGSGIFITCNNTKSDCIARGMYSQDSSARKTGRFCGIQWAPPVPEQQNKSYVQGKNITTFSSRNDSIYSRRYPLLYGQQWVKSPVNASVLGDGNATRGETVICCGDIGTGGVQEVVINGVIVPPVEGADPLQRWNFLDQKTINSKHTGSRNGYANTDNGWNGNGDPYGSLAAIEWVCFNQLVQSNSVPDIKIRSNGPRIFKYAKISSYSSGVITFPGGYTNTEIAGNPPFTIQIVSNSLLTGTNSGVYGLSSWTSSTITLTGGPAGSSSGGYVRYLSWHSNNPAWVIYDLLIWSNYSFAELDIDSFIDAATYCDQTISYIDQTGNPNTHARFICEFSLEDQKKANSVIQSVLRSFNAQLIPNSETGLTQLFIRRTLAEQQPSSLSGSGSNYNTAIASFKADGTTTANGFVAYKIDSSVIEQEKRGANTVPMINGPYCLPNSQNPNSISFSFQDSENTYQDDSISITDPDDVARAAGYQLGGAQIPAGYDVRGIQSFDQGLRCGNVIIAEGLRGNKIGDTRGTKFWDVVSTVRLEHLRLGQIVLFDPEYAQLQPAVQLQSPPGTPISGILCRVEALQPSTNGERWTVKLRWHEDAWYTDPYGQHGPRDYSNPLQSLAPRPPYPWKPKGEQPISGDSVFSQSRWSFGIAQSYVTAENGAPIATLTCYGNPPVNQISTVTQPPRLAIQGTTANTGGTIAGGRRIFFAISAQDPSGNWSSLSKIGFVDVPSGTNTNTITTPTIAWQTGTSAWVIFAGLNDQIWCEQDSGTGTTPSTITLTSLSEATYGPPDALADSIQFTVKRLYHSGPFGDMALDVHSNGDGTGTISFGTVTTDHQFAQIDSTHGYDLSVLARPQGDSAAIPIADFHVIDNVAGTLSGNPVSVYHVKPDPHSIVDVGWIFEMRFLPTIITSTTIGDPNTVSAYYGGNGFGASGDEEKGRRVLIVSGTGAGQERGILGNNSTTLTIDRPWDTTPDNTSRYIILENASQAEPLSKQSAANFTASPAPSVAAFSIDNYRQQAVLISADVVDATGASSLSRYSPLREVYIWGAQGTRVVSADDTQMVTDRIINFDTSAPTHASTTDTLSAAITSTTDGTVHLTGTTAVNGTVLTVGTERMLVLDGGGTSTVDVERGFDGTTAATHSNGASVTIPGWVAFQLLNIDDVPNQDMIFYKVTADTNYALIKRAGTDVFPGGLTQIILADNSTARGVATITAPGS